MLTFTFTLPSSKGEIILLTNGYCGNRTHNRSLRRRMLYPIELNIQFTTFLKLIGWFILLVLILSIYFGYALSKSKFSK